MTNSIREIIANMPNVHTLTQIQYEILKRFRHDKERNNICSNVACQHMLISECRYIDSVIESQYKLINDLPPELKQKVIENRQGSNINVNVNELNIEDINFILDSIVVLKPGTIVKINDKIGVLLGVEPYLHGYGYDLASPINGGTVIKYLKDAIVVKQSIKYDGIKSYFNPNFISQYNLDDICYTNEYVDAIVYEPINTNNSFEFTPEFFQSLYPSTYIDTNISYDVEDETSDE